MAEMGTDGMFDAPQNLDADATPDDPENKAKMLDELGIQHLDRFRLFGTLEDLQKAISSQSHAVSITPDGHAYKPGRLGNLGNSYQCRFERLGEPADIDRAIACNLEAVSLTPDDHEDKRGWLSNLGGSYQRRFESLGDLADIDQAIACKSEAVSLTPNGHADKPGWLSNLGNSYACRYGRLGELADVDRAIVYISEAVSLTPDGHASKPTILNNLGSSYQCRFESLGDVAGIDRAIACISEALSLAPDDHAGKPGYLTNLGNSYQCRFQRLGQISDIDQAIACKSEAVSLTPDGHASKPGWLGNLGNSYSCRFERLGKVADIDRAIECNSDAVSLTPDGHAGKHKHLTNLGSSYQCRSHRFGELADINRAIACISEAVSLTPDGHANKPIVLTNLGSSYQCRFERLGELADIDRAIICIWEAVSLTPDSHANKPAVLNNLGSSYQCRFERLGEVADIDQAIACISAAVSLAPDGHANKPKHLTNLGSSYQCRFERLGQLSDIERAIVYKSEAVSLAPDGHASKPAWLTNLGNSYMCRFEHLGEVADIDQAIACNSDAVSLTPDGHASKPSYLTNLGSSYQGRFDRLGELADIDRAIARNSDAVSLTPDGHADKPGRLDNLGVSYERRFKRLGEHTGVEQAILFFQMAAQSPVGNSSIRFRASRRWAASALISNHSTTIQAYRQAMALVPKVVWIGSTINHRYDNIHSIGTVAVEAAASAISAKQYDLALEWLEAGRSVVWAQTLQLRTQFDDLSMVAPDLAKRLTEVAQELEATSRRDTTAPMANTIALEDVAQRHRRLAEEYEKLLYDVRQIPGFQDFMEVKKVEALMPAAQSGPVVVVNVHCTRCDALILLPHKDSLTHVPLPDLSADDVAKLQSRILGLLGSSRSRGRRPQFWDQPSDQFQNVLAALWHKIVEPVLRALGYIQNPPVEPLPHITWCTTGSLSFLPIHAAGCYDEVGPRIFDFVVSSYTPNLGTLISTGSRSLEVGKILAVSQENSLPKTKDELAHIRRHSKTFQYMQLENDDATPQAVLDAMAECDCVHLACHGLQKIYKPTESYFALHQGNLTLSEITKQSPANKGLAFLSACQTATGDAKMPDEAVHLAAGMLIAGYPTVIATMWSIEDEDAPLVADKVYGELLKDGRLDGGRVARALHAAVKNLRNKIGEERFYRWVPYIHLGV